MSPEIQNVSHKSKSLDAAVKDGMAHAAMVGAGETYINAYGLFLRASSFQIGILTSVPPLIGSICQLFSVWVMERLQSRKRILVISVTAQAFLWLPIALIPFLFGLGPASVSALIACFTIYHILASFVTPIWNSLIGDLVPVANRGQFFGYRNKRTGIVTCLTLVAAGQTLHLFKTHSYTMYGFFIIFLVAAIARLRSAYWLTKYEDPSYHINESQRFSFLQFIRRSPKSNFAKFVFFVSCMNFSAFISAPYFTLYMLNDAGMSYLEYTILIAVGIISQFLPMQYWGKLSDPFGNRKILTVCGFGISLAPILWLISANSYVLVLVQIYSGFMWAGFNLAAANFMFDAVSPPKRARCVAYQSIINSTFVLAGSLLGAYLAKNLPDSLPFSQGIFTPQSAFLRVFVISGLLRLITALTFLRLFREVREVAPIRHRDLIFRITHLRAQAGISFGLVTGTIEHKEKNSREAQNHANLDK